MKVAGVFTTVLGRDTFALDYCGVCFHSHCPFSSGFTISIAISLCFPRHGPRAVSAAVSQM